MSLIDIPLDRIGQDNLRRMIATKVAESVYMDICVVGDPNKTEDLNGPELAVWYDERRV
jgi:hypothetical protein